MPSQICRVAGAATRPPWPACVTIVTTTYCGGWPAGPPNDANHEVGCLCATSAVPVLPPTLTWPNGNFLNAAVAVPFFARVTSYIAAMMSFNVPGPTGRRPRVGQAMGCTWSPDGDTTALPIRGDTRRPPLTRDSYATAS